MYVFWATSDMVCFPSALQAAKDGQIFTEQNFLQRAGRTVTGLPLKLTNDYEHIYRLLTDICEDISELNDWCFSGQMGEAHEVGLHRHAHLFGIWAPWDL